MSLLLERILVHSWDGDNYEQEIKLTNPSGISILAIYMYVSKIKEKKMYRGLETRLRLELLAYCRGALPLLLSSSPVVTRCIS